MPLQRTLSAVREVALNPEPLGFKRGFAAPFRAVKLLATNPEFLGLAIAPWVINLIVVLPLSIWLAKNTIYDWIVGFAPEGPGAGPAALRITVSILAVPVTLSSIAMVLLVAALVLGAPFHDLMGDRIERHLLRARPDLQAPSLPIWRAVRHAILEALRRLLLAIPALFGVLFIGLVPVIGPPIAFILQGILAALFLTFDAFAIPMDRRSIGVGAKLRWLNANRRFAFGFGLPMLLIPCSIFLMPPLAAAAASLVYSELLLLYHPKPAEPESHPSP